MLKTIRIATRKSPLAMIQAELVGDSLLKTQAVEEVEYVGVSTRADKDLSRSTEQLGGRDAFVEEVEQLIHRGRADIAVHSAKDVGYSLEDTNDLLLTPLLERAPINDQLVTRHPLADISELPADCTIATSSLRRERQLRTLLPECKIVPIRGNINTRIGKLVSSEEIDALVLAQAGTSRLGIDDIHTLPLTSDLMLPAVGQGALLVQHSEEFSAKVEMCVHLPTLYCVLAERSFAKVLGATCHSAVAASATLDHQELRLSAWVGGELNEHWTDQTTCILNHDDSGNIQTARILGQQLGEKALQHGAKAYL